MSFEWFILPLKFRILMQWYLRYIFSVKFWIVQWCICRLLRHGDCIDTLCLYFFSWILCKALSLLQHRRSIQHGHFGTSSSVGANVLSKFPAAHRHLLARKRGSFAKPYYKPYHPFDKNTVCSLWDTLGVALYFEILNQSERPNII